MEMSSPEVVAKPGASLSVVEAGGPYDEEPQEHSRRQHSVSTKDAKLTG